MEKLFIPPGTDLFFGKALIQTELLEKLSSKLGYRTAIIADEAVKDLYTKGEVFTIPSGEKSKTREMKAHLEDQLLSRGFGRDTVIVAIGGGVTTDLAGFVAATFMRGVPLILVPTTLIGMVDAAIGGKTAVDTPLGKNLIGAFYPPREIVVDLDALKTLPEKERLSGQSEILKMGLIWDPEILTAPPEEQILRAIKAKIEITQRDPTEKGLRRVLNFGHTIGHAIEFLSNYTISHGQAVGIGCVAESYLSMRLGYLSPDAFEQIQSLFPKFQWNFNARDLQNSMHMDKKSAKGKVRSVLIDRIGRALPFEGECCTEISAEDFDAVFHWMEQNSV